MAMVTGYFDDSGHPDNGAAIVVAGFVSTVDKWLFFEKEWRAVLDEFGIKVFHMKDYAHSNGEFKKWKGDLARRRDFLSGLCEVISRRVCKSVSSVILLEEYREADQKYVLREWFPPYALCGANVAFKTKNWAARRKHGQIEYIFEDGSKHKGKLMQVMEEFGYPMPIFKKKEDFGALQAADFVAYEHLCQLKKAETGTLDRFRKSFAQLCKIPHDWGVFSRGRILANCRDAGVQLRKVQLQ